MARCPSGGYQTFENELIVLNSGAYARFGRILTFKWCDMRVSRPERRVEECVGDLPELIR